jgi:hypothetical protein
VGVAIGDEVVFELEPEGPQGGDLADDIAEALAANPAAATFFHTLAQFYRKAYLRWIDATTRRPDVRAARTAEVVDLLGPGSSSGQGHDLLPGCSGPEPGAGAPDAAHFRALRSSSARVGQAATARRASGSRSCGTGPGAMIGYPQGSALISSGSNSMQTP